MEERITIDSAYFRALPGLMSGIDLTPLDGKKVLFVNCDFHPECEELRVRNRDNWTVVSR